MHHDKGSTVEDPANRWYNLSAAAAAVPTAVSNGEGKPQPHQPQQQQQQQPAPANQGDTPYDLFSATCLYFGIELSDMLGDNAPPIGLVQSAVGGSTIEAWMSNTTRQTCTDELVHKKSGGLNQGTPGQLYYGYAAPFVNMTMAGFLWYQGERCACVCVSAHVCARALCSVQRLSCPCKIGYQ